MQQLLTTAYVASPPIVALSTSVSSGTTSGEGNISFEFDILSDPLTSYAAPGRPSRSPPTF